MPPRSPDPLRLGFAPLADAAPLIVADQLGIFRRHGLDVRLSREVGWATIRDKIAQGELAAAQAPAPMLWALRLGIGCAACDALTSHVLSLNGNALVLSRSLTAPLSAARLSRPLTLAAAFRFSAQYLLLREWLDDQGIGADTQARIVVLPPVQMVRNLEAGTIDGFAADEPWNSLAIQRGLGWSPAWAAARRRDEMEKVLVVTEAFAETRAPEHMALIAALMQAAAWCEAPEHRAELNQLLSSSAYLGKMPTLNFPLFHGFEANRPTTAKAVELQTRLAAAGLIPRDTAIAKLLFRPDLRPPGAAQ